MLKRLNLEITVLFYYWRREYIQVFRNVEALVFFVLLPLAYGTDFQKNTTERQVPLSCR